MSNVHKFILRPEKSVSYFVGGFEFLNRASAHFLHREMRRHARLETTLFVDAVEAHEELVRTRLDYPEFTAFFVERLLDHWQEVLKMPNNSHQDVVALMRELVNGDTDWR